MCKKIEVGDYVKSIINKGNRYLAIRIGGNKIDVECCPSGEIYHNCVISWFEYDYEMNRNKIINEILQ